MPLIPGKKTAELSQRKQSLALEQYQLPTSMEKRSLCRRPEREQTRGFWQSHHLSLGMVQKLQIIPVSKWGEKPQKL